VSRWVVVVLATVAVALLPLAASLGVELPSEHRAQHWNVAWTGFDVALAAVLLGTAVAALRSSAWLPRLAMAGGTMLVTDAWFDTLTARTQAELTIALVEAAVAELPLALLCFAIAADTGRVWRRQRLRPRDR
jgi:hypothetical protein